MMSTTGEKRKHESDRSKSARLRKRQKSVKYHETQNSRHSSRSSQGQVWQARAILEEKVIKGKKYYLIDWEGIDPATGQKYEPSWGDKPTKALLKDWQQRRKSRSSQSPSLALDEPKAETKRHERLRRVIDSSSPRRGYSKSTSPLQSTHENSPAFSGEETSPAQTASPHFESNHSEHVEIQQSLKSNFNSPDYVTVPSQPHRYTPVSGLLRQPYEPDAVIPDSQPPSPKTLPSDRNLSIPGEVLDVLPSIDTYTNFPSAKPSLPSSTLEANSVEVSGYRQQGQDPPATTPTDSQATTDTEPSLLSIGGRPTPLQSEGFLISDGQGREEFARTWTESLQSPAKHNPTQSNFHHVSPLHSGNSPDVQLLTRSTYSSPSHQPSVDRIDWANSHFAEVSTSVERATPITSEVTPGVFTSTKEANENQQPHPTRPSSIASFEPSSTSSSPQTPSQDPETFPADLRSSVKSPLKMPGTRRSRQASKPSGSTTPSAEAISEPLEKPSRTRKGRVAKAAQKRTALDRVAKSSSNPGSPSSSNSKEQLPTSDSTSTEGEEASPTHLVTQEQDSIESTEDGSASAPPFGALESVAADAMETNDDTVDSTDSSEQVAEGPSLDKMEFIVALPMTGTAIDQYKHTLAYQKDVIRKLCSRNWPEDSTIYQEAETLLQTLRDITLHMDLTNKSLSQAEKEPRLLAEWYRTSGSKFKFLHHFLDVLRVQSMNIVIVWRHKGLISMLEKFLTGMGINWLRADQNPETQGSISQDQLTVTLLPANGNGADAISKPPSLLISLDLSIDVSAPYIKTLRQRTANPDRLIPVVSLVVLDSIDHIDRSVSPTITGVDRLRLLLHCAAVLRKVAGRLHGYPPVQESAMDVARFVSMKGTEDTWPLPPIGELDDEEVWGLVQAEVPLPIPQVVASPSSIVLKRSIEQLGSDNIEGASTKRVRITPQPEPDMSTTHISDSNVGPSSSINKTPTSSNELASLRSMLKAAEEALQEKDAIIKSKDDMIRAESKRWYELDKAINDLQFRFEDQSKENRQLKNKVEELETGLGMAQKQRESREATIASLKEEITKWRTELTSARDLLATSVVPEVAELERLRKERDSAEERARKATKRADDNENIIGYTRKQYDEATERVAELNQANEEFRTRLQKVEKLAHGEVSKAREMNLHNQTTIIMKENENLRRQCNELEYILKRKEEELKNKRTIITRGGSVPRSPRIGPTSRAGSPITDRRVGALKSNNFQRRRAKPAPSEDVTEPPSNTPAPPLAYAEHHLHTALTMNRGQHQPIEPRYIMVQPQHARAFDPSRPPPLEPRPIELKPADMKPGSGVKTTDPKSGVLDSKTGPSVTRPFPCTFAQYNCTAAFTSKNEWKRHISTKHIQLGFWRCDMCPPSPGIDQPVYNDFNRKDLFTQHLRRMHGGAPATPSKDAPQTPGSEQLPPSASQPSLTEDQIQEIQKRCYRQLRSPPPVSNCVLCPRTFSGPNSWEERLEHVGGHLERERKNGGNAVDVTTWRQDPALRDYLLIEGIIEMDPVRGVWRIGDGKPKRDVTMIPQLPVSPVGFGLQQPPTGLPLGASQASAITIDTESEGSSGKRKRGRPVKRFSLNDPPQETQYGDDQVMVDAPPPPPELSVISSPQPSHISTSFQTQLPMQSPIQYFTPLQGREGVATGRSGPDMPPQPTMPMHPQEHSMAPDSQPFMVVQHVTSGSHIHLPSSQSSPLPQPHPQAQMQAPLQTQPQMHIQPQGSPAPAGVEDSRMKTRGRTFREVIL